MYKTSEVPDVSLQDDMQARLKQETIPGYFVYSTSEIKGLVRNAATARYDVYVIFLRISGVSETSINGRDYTSVKNMVFITTPSTIVSVRKISDDYESIFIACPHSFVARAGMWLPYESILHLFGSNNDPMLRVTDEQAATLLFLLKRLRELSANQNQRFYEEMTQNYFTILLYELAITYNAAHVGEPIRLARKEELVALFIKKLSVDFKKEHEVGFYAGALGVSPKYLSEVIKDLTGKTAGTIIDEAIIAEAKRMLSKPESTIAGVASELYFSDQSAFGKFFKRYVGLAPSDYRVAR
jgi:AraC family transcriptional regulator, transcriptional activator of pobA